MGVPVSKAKSQGLREWEMETNGGSIDHMSATVEGMKLALRYSMIQSGV
jgi:hypothetical protein